MIAYRYRFHGHTGLRYLHTYGHTTRGSLLSVRAVANQRRRDVRAVVIVGKKVVKSAVKRNRIRRRVYEILRRHWQALPENTDIAVTVVTAEVGTMPASDLEAQMVALLRQAQLYQSPDQSDKINHDEHF